ncbi:putative integral membrane protein [Methylophaga frappieri]|uniref:Putative integral membrane protein n=1 Tax=Methylophaga frappieri (strain ATCC BAA-2434 / DSM 25690 / JAM7) TaxID=754477 RepID=I1YKZ2_METFJ|nr:CopD family protein [Methylophaga frappieri]AFJ03585.1 putative integral membrane protein [Methylophaga frappieri]
MGFAISLHILATVIWVGGMFFAFMFLRPAAATMLAPEQRLPLWRNIFGRFFPWIWASIAIILITGISMIVMLGGFGGLSGVGVHVHIMLLLGILMMLLFMHVYFNPFRKLKWAVAEQDWLTASNALDNIRKFIRANLILGLIVIVIGISGRYW